MGSPAQVESFVTAQDQTSAILVIGRARHLCQIVSMSIQGFVVRIEGDEHLAARGTIRLQTPGATYCARLTRQEATDSGVELTLVRVDDCDDNLPFPQRWVVHTSRCCAIGLIIGLTYCLVVKPGPLLGVPGVRHLGDVVQAWRGIDPDEDVRRSESLAQELPTISVSLVDSQPAPTDSSHKPNSSYEPLLKAAVAAAQRKRSRPLNSATVPWLGRAGDETRCRLAATAESDLRQFHAGLATLAAQESADAVRSLGDALRRISPMIDAPTEVPGVHRVDSADAEIFFRCVDGEPEILRVLPLNVGSGPSAHVDPAADRM